jgi:hypothetical protein
MTIKVFPKRLVLENSLLNKEIQSMFRWIFLTIRKQVPDSIGLSTMYQLRSRPNHFSLSNMKPYPKSEGLGNCWKRLFKSAVITIEPKKHNQEACRGLELDCHIMIRFAAVEYPVLIDTSPDNPLEPGLVFLGYSNALIPVREISDEMILWHLETSNDDSQIKVSDLEAIRSD